jgi:phosphoenolpyruvate-protein phosphotransferase (PTS system enzyme I)
VNEHATIAGLAYKGLKASVGFAHGPFVRADRAASCERVAAAPLDEQAALRTAVLSAGQQITKLADSVGGDAAEILEFQVALLEDDEFLDPIFAAIAEDVPAHTAWSAALEAQMGDYNAAADEYLQARSSDLADLRDRVLRTLRGGESEAPRIPRGAVVLAEDLPPSQFLEIDWSAGGGLALLRGSPASHVAMLARARGLPMVVQLGSVPANARTALLDGEAATLELDPDAEQIGLFEHRRDLFRKNRASLRAILARPTASWAGEKIKLLINIQRVEDLDHADAQYADGIGLMRTEFLLGQQSGLPDEETQFRAYDAGLRWAGKRPVTIRTFDAGGDKPVSGFTLDGEANPFLGVRGLRLCLARPDIFRVQLRALARAAVHDNLKVMFPMVTTPAELEAARQIFVEAVDQLQSEGIPAELPKIGVMVEVPAAALAVDQFDAAFLSIGSNDLAQYLMACDRTNGALTNLIDPLQPAMLNLIKHIVDQGKQAGREVSLCGDMAGDPRCVAKLLSCGLRELSVSPSALALIKQTIDALSSGSTRV